MGKGISRFIVKLELSLKARTERDAVDFLLRAVRTAADGDPGRVVEALRTDVRRPGEIGDW